MGREARRPRRRLRTAAIEVLVWTGREGGTPSTGRTVGVQRQRSPEALGSCWTEEFALVAPHHVYSPHILNQHWTSASSKNRIKTTVLLIYNEANWFTSCIFPLFFFSKNLQIKQKTTYSIKTFIQTWYNKQKRDSELMTEKKKVIFCFSSLNPEAHDSQSAPRVWWNKNTEKNRTETEEKRREREGDKLKGWVPFWFYRLFYLLNTWWERKGRRRVGRIAGGRKPDAVCVFNNSLSQPSRKWCDVGFLLKSAPDQRTVSSVTFLSTDLLSLYISTKKSPNSLRLSGEPAQAGASGSACVDHRGGTWPFFSSTKTQKKETSSELQNLG